MPSTKRSLSSPTVVVRWDTDGEEFRADIKGAKDDRATAFDSDYESIIGTATAMAGPSGKVIDRTPKGKRTVLARVGTVPPSESPKAIHGSADSNPPDTQQAPNQEDKPLKTLIAINLNGHHQGLSRWALYESTTDGLNVLWGDTSNHEKPRPQYPCQTYSKRDNYPAFHFVIRGYGHSHIHSLACDLARHFRQSVQLIQLNGWQPVSTIVREGC